MYTLPLLKVAESSFMCPICYDLYKQPVALPCMHIFCTECASKFLDQRSQCPLCNTEVRSRRSLTPVANLSLFSTVLRGLVSEAVHMLKSMPSPAQGSDTPSAYQSKTKNISAPQSHLQSSVAADGKVHPNQEEDDEDNDNENSNSIKRRIHFEERSSGEINNDGPRAPSPPPPPTMFRLKAADMGNSLTQRLFCTPPEGDTTPPPPDPSKRSRKSTDEDEEDEALNPSLSKFGTATPQLASRAGTTQGRSSTKGEGPEVRRPPTKLLPGSWELELIPPSEREREAQGPKGTGHVKASLHLNGCCVLCGLDIMDRGSVRRYLKSLLESPSSGCTTKSLAAVTEAQLGSLLGALWEVRCYRVERGQRHLHCTVLSHHNCLSWAGLLQLYTSELLQTQKRLHRTPLHLPLRLPDDASEPNPSWSVLQNLTHFLITSSASTPAVPGRKKSSSDVCYICGRDSITHELPRMALRPCKQHDYCHRLFHFPCALLAGEDSCIVFGLEERDIDLCTDCPLEGEVVDAKHTKKRARLEPVDVWCGWCYREDKKKKKD